MRVYDGSDSLGISAYFRLVILVCSVDFHLGIASTAIALDIATIWFSFDWFNSAHLHPFQFVICILSAQKEQHGRLL